MYAEPSDVDRAQLVEALRTAWGIRIESLDYEPVGFGSDHYTARDGDARRWFVTLDDLRRKPWMAEDPDDVFDGLDGAFRTAVALRSIGLEFVHAPTQRPEGGVLCSIGSHYAMSVFSFVDGRSSTFHERPTDPERRVVLSALGRLHGSTDDMPAGLTRRDSLEIPLRTRLFENLEDLGSTWTGGPFSEPTRQLLLRSSARVRDMFAAYDELTAVVDAAGDRWVITHGEPHAGNVMWTVDDELVLIDWDTVALAPRERDLWMLAPKDDQEWRAYASAGGSRDMRPASVELYRLRWSLSEIADYVGLFRSAHRDDPNTTVAWSGLQAYVTDT